jgi:hypothetical protein
LQTIVNDYPYHVDALIQLSELCKVAEDHAMAAELIERAIYALEMAFHPSFNVCRGDCRLSYDRQENRLVNLMSTKNPYTIVFI